MVQILNFTGRTATLGRYFWERRGGRGLVSSKAGMAEWIGAVSKTSGADRFRPGGFGLDKSPTLMIGVTLSVPNI